MGKSLKNSVSPDEMYARYGADTLRLYEMAMGPLDTDRPWRTNDIVGVHRFLQRLWRAIIDESTGKIRVSDQPLDHESLQRLHRTIMIVRKDFEGLRFNTAIARLMELTSHAVKLAADNAGLPRAMAEPLVLMVAPLAPHVAEELWTRLGHGESLTYAAFPEADERLAAGEVITLPVQINGKTRFTINVGADASEEEIERLLRSRQDFAQYTEGLAVKRLIIVAREDRQRRRALVQPSPASGGGGCAEVSLARGSGPGWNTAGPGDWPSSGRAGRAVSGPGAPVPTGLPSMTVTGMIPPAVEVMRTSCARLRSRAVSRPWSTAWQVLGGQLDHRAPGDALQRAAARRQPAPVDVSEHVETRALGDRAGQGPAARRSRHHGRRRPAGPGPCRASDSSSPRVDALRRDAGHLADPHAAHPWPAARGC